MKKHYWMKTTVAAGLFASTVAAQNNQQQARITGGGGPDWGKCTIEVVVDDVAQVEVRGTSANLRTLSGQPAQWRRFECTSPMPANAGNFQFHGVDGRGRQSLVRDPRNGGAAVIEIEDKDGGSEGYTFDLTWGNGGPVTDRRYPEGGAGRYPDAGGAPAPRGDYRYPNDQYRPNYREGDYYRRYQHGFGTDEAVRVCQEGAMDEASKRFRTREIHLHRTTVDDRPGRQDWVVGSLDIHRGNHEERYGFSCSVDFQSGRVRSVDLDTRPLPEDPRWR